ncbi:MAG TPA: hypothetical protein VFM24_03235 [Nitrospira sp.]|nr:hypothetical protein [Nitrospira sp.]
MSLNEALEPHEKAIGAIGAVIAHAEAEGKHIVSGSLPCPVCAVGQLSWLQLNEGKSVYYQCNSAECISGHIAR